jgi:hypothetical protein
MHDIGWLKLTLYSGLGVGTAPAALTAHGVNTTTVEIDPVVADFAERYFDLPKNHTTVVEDATSFVPRTVQSSQRYDYIIHDVFTGGAEPVALFTSEFLTGLYDLLQPNGAIAIVCLITLSLLPLYPRLIHADGVHRTMLGICPCLRQASSYEPFAQYSPSAASFAKTSLPSTIEQHHPSVTSPIWSYSAIRFPLHLSDSGRRWKQTFWVVMLGDGI